MTSLTRTPSSSLVPQDVLNAYLVPKGSNIRQLTHGVINTTFFLQLPSGEKYILQRLNPLFNESTVTDTSEVLRYLQSVGWLLQQIVPLPSQRLSYRDKMGKLWRLLTYVPAEDAPQHMDVVQLYAVGALLARLHSDLHACNYRPTFALPHFHQTDFYCQNLAAVWRQLPISLQTLAKQSMKAYEALGRLPPIRAQLIHGDPRTTNILFRHGQPFCYIDFDTLMLGSTWIDIGDLLRSISGSNDQTEVHLSKENICAVVQGYYSYSAHLDHDTSFGAYLQTSLRAMRIISLELAMRFLTDVVEDTYFGWDSTKFSSRRENNIVRAKTQWAIYEQSFVHFP